MKAGIGLVRVGICRFIYRGGWYCLGVMDGVHLQVFFLRQRGIGIA